RCGSRRASTIFRSRYPEKMTASWAVTKDGVRALTAGPDGDGWGSRPALALDAAGVDHDARAVRGNHRDALVVEPRHGHAYRLGEIVGGERGQGLAVELQGLLDLLLHDWVSRVLANRRSM